MLNHTSTSSKKLRILCLHGMYQNGKTFANKIQHLTHCSPWEFLFLDGPFAILPKVLAKNQHTRQSRVRILRINEKKEEEFRAWWRPATSEKSPMTEHELLTQMTQDREVLLEYLNQKIASFGGEIDGVFGFSQGASLASWLCSTEAQAELCWRPQFAVLVGGYLGPSIYRPVSEQTQIVSDLSSLHVYGLNDHVISAKKSQNLMEIFEQKAQKKDQVLSSVHEQGHVVPKTDDVVTCIQSFLATQHTQLHTINTTISTTYNKSYTLQKSTSSSSSNSSNRSSSDNSSSSRHFSRSRKTYHEYL